MFLTDFFLITFFILFLIGLSGFFTTNYNIIKLFISLELQFLAISGLFLTVTFITSNGIGLIITFFILMIAGAESSVGLILFLIISEEIFSINLHSLKFLKH